MTAPRVLRSGTVLALLACIALAVPPATAQAQSRVSFAELRDLVGSARQDPAALHDLMEVRYVDGRAADLRRALAEARDDELEHRLQALEKALAPEEVSGERSRAPAEAAAILSDDAYREPDVPQPLGGLVRWFRQAMRPVGDLLRRLAARIPGGGATLWVAFAAIVVVASAFTATRLARRRTRAQTARRQEEEPRDDARSLLRAADAAERTGDLTQALRLRFRAGLLHLNESGLARPRPSMTSAELRRMLRSPSFDQLALDFDQIVYGGRAASPPDLATARAGWERVPAEVKQR